MENGISALQHGMHTEHSVPGQTEFYLLGNNRLLVSVIRVRGALCLSLNIHLRVSLLSNVGVLHEYLTRYLFLWALRALRKPAALVPDLNGKLLLSSLCWIVTAAEELRVPLSELSSFSDPRDIHCSLRASMPGLKPQLHLSLQFGSSGNWYLHICPFPQHKNYGREKYTGNLSIAAYRGFWCNVLATSLCSSDPGKAQQNLLFWFSNSLTKHLLLHDFPRWALGLPQCACCSALRNCPYFCFCFLS